MKKTFCSLTRLYKIIKYLSTFISKQDRLLMECIGAIQELDRKQRKGHHTLAVCIVIIFIFVASNFGVFIFHCFF